MARRARRRRGRRRGQRRRNCRRGGRGGRGGQRRRRCRRGGRGGQRRRHCRRGQRSGGGLNLLGNSAACYTAAQLFFGTEHAEAMNPPIQLYDIDSGRPTSTRILDPLSGEYCLSNHSTSPIGHGNETGVSSGGKARASKPAASGSKVCTAASHSQPKGQNGVGLQSANAGHQFLAFRIGEHLVHLDANSCICDADFSIESLKVEVGCDEKSTKGLLPTIGERKCCRNVLDQAESTDYNCQLASEQKCIDYTIDGDGNLEATSTQASSFPGSSGSVQSASSHDSLQVFVKLLDFPTLSVQIECKASVQELVIDAIRKSGLCVNDSKVQVDGKLIALDKLLDISMANATFFISPRIRGGYPTIPPSFDITLRCESLHDFILRQGDLLFEVVRFTDPQFQSLRPGYFVALGKAGRKIYNWLFTLVELYHASWRVLVPFTVWDIVYVPDLDCLMFFKPKFETQWSTLAYRRNILNVGTILESYLRYSPAKVATNKVGIHEMNKLASLLPNHLQLLVDYIKEEWPKRNEAEDGLSVQWRCIFRLDPAGMSSAEKIGLILSFDLKAKYLSDSERKALAQFLGSSSFSWVHVVKPIPVLKKVLDFEFYDRNTGVRRKIKYKDLSLFSLWWLGRNYLSHSEDEQMDLKLAEAVFNFLFTYLLPLVMRALIRRYRDPAVACKGQNKLTFHEVFDKA